VATGKELIPSPLLATRTFREDLKRLLNLPPGELLWMNSIADGADGFSPGRQSMKLAQHAGIDPQDAIGVLRAAQYIYERAHESSISAEDATRELLEIAPTLDVQDVGRLADPLRALLATKDRYEVERYAKSEGLIALPHFTGMEGVWDIRPIFNRDTGEVLTTVATLILNVSWHDSVRNDYSTVFQLTADEWTELREALDKLERERQVMERYRAR
jgi:hypothetical protein